MGWDVNVHWHLLHEVDATLRMGFGGVGWDVNVRWHLLHEVAATLGMEFGEWGGMLTFVGTCFMKLMLRWGWKRSLAYLTMCVLLTSCK